MLQVQTKLENPTRYHVMQKQKSQVRQYLNGNGLLSPLQTRTCISAQNNSAPGFAGNYSTGVTPMEQMPSQSHSISMYSAVPSPSSDAPAMSPALSSGATSTSEVSKTIYC